MAKTKKAKRTKTAKKKTRKRRMWATRDAEDVDGLYCTYYAEPTRRRNWDGFHWLKPNEVYDAKDWEMMMRRDLHLPPGGGPIEVPLPLRPAGPVKKC